VRHPVLNLIPVDKSEDDGGQSQCKDHEEGPVVLRG
jgi:hypothetical protein